MALFWALARWVGMPVFALLLIALVAELTVIIAVGQAIGTLLTILLLVAVSMVGMALLRKQGFRTLMSANEAMRDRRGPSPEMTDGVLLAVAAGLVLFPGFVSDLGALFLLFPPTRAIVRRRILRRAATRRQGYVVVDGEVVADEPPADVIVIDGRPDEPR